MSFVSTLTAKGVSRTGAIEVSLGLPLSSHADRSVLQRLNLPLARTSLSKPISTTSPFRPPPAHLTPDQVAGQVMEATVNQRNLTVLQAYWAKQRSEEKAALEKAIGEKNEKMLQQLKSMSEAVERLRAQIEDVQRISGNPWRQLLGFFAHNPFWPWEWDNWHRQVDATRKALDDHKKVARTLAAQIDKNRGSVGLG